MCRLDSDGRLTIVTGAADMTGVETTFAAIAADAFGVSPDRVRVNYADTSSAPYAGMSGGSKITYTVGRAVELAALEARERLLDVAAEELEISPEDLEIVDGSVRPVGVPAKAMAIEQLAQKVLTFGSPYPPVEGHGRVSLSPAPQSAAHLSHVRVDRDTGAVTVLGHVIAQDVGRALNPALVEGQMQGGATQGLGWALLEELAYDEHGQPVAGSFVDYAMPTAGGVPRIDTQVVEVPAPDGPFGAKGVGEAPVVGVPGAVANAVAAATGGVRMRRLPMTPERVWRAIDGNGDGRALADELARWATELDPSEDDLALARRSLLDTVGGDVRGARAPAARRVRRSCPRPAGGRRSRTCSTTTTSTCRRPRTSARCASRWRSRPRRGRARATWPAPA